MEPVTDILNEPASRRITVEQAADRLPQGMDRGERSLVVDENLRGLEGKPAELVDTVDTRPPDEQIKPLLKNRVLITEEGKHLAGNIDKPRYGPIWIGADLPYADLARKMMCVFRQVGFRRNRVLVVEL